jgi:hypothetical protein
LENRQIKMKTLDDLILETRATAAKGANSSFSPSGYSQFYKRLAIRDGLRTKARNINPYGLKQALEHITELRRHVYGDRKIYSTAAFEVIKTTTLTEVVAVVA